MCVYIHTDGFNPFSSPFRPVRSFYLGGRCCISGGISARSLEHYALSSKRAESCSSRLSLSTTVMDKNSFLYLWMVRFSPLKSRESLHQLPNWALVPYFPTWLLPRCCCCSRLLTHRKTIRTSTTHCPPSFSPKWTPKESFLLWFDPGWREGS